MERELEREEIGSSVRWERCIIVCFILTPRYYSHYQSASFSLPSPNLTAKTLHSHSPVLFSLPERFILTPRYYSHYQSASFSLPGPIPATSALHTHPTVLFLQPEHFILTPPNYSHSLRASFVATAPILVSYLHLFLLSYSRLTTHVYTPMLLSYFTTTTSH